MPGARPTNQVREVLELKSSGMSDRAVSELTAVPVDTIRTWRKKGLSARAVRELSIEAFCPRCGGEAHHHSLLPARAYAYLLGLYLGDGCLHDSGDTCYLRITLDTAYPGIIASCRAAIAAVKDRELPWCGRPNDGSNCVNVASYGKQWRCLFPQHGPGRKHSRRIELVEWQREIVAREPEALLRGLIHSDGWRGANRVFVKGRWYAYPRYQFSNRSDDIRRIFTDTCDLIGVKWRPWGRWHISVARRESVARLDEFIGPKR